MTTTAHRGLALALGLFAAAPARAQDCLHSEPWPNGTDLQLTTSGSGATRVVPLPFWFPFDGEDYCAITVSANGFVWLGVDRDAGDVVSETAFLQGGPRIAPGWNRLDPGAGGGVLYHETPTQVSVIWDRVPEVPMPPHGSGEACMELILTAGGDIYLHYLGGHAYTTPGSLAGISAGGGVAANPVNWSGIWQHPVPTIPGATGYEVFPLYTFNLTDKTYKLTRTSATEYGVSLLQQNALPACPPNPGPVIPTYADASLVRYGIGCSTASAGQAFFESFGPGAVDLSNTGWRFTANGATSYSVSQIPVAFDPGYGPADDLDLDDEEQAPASLAAMGGFPL
ncbi:MAG: hypothetical protein KAI24_03785, partial [Planctomycetes bacterium]|nr:hypothetical protein [Planctomycetota bacterium]